METPLRQLSWLTSPYTRSKSVSWRPRSDRLLLLLLGEHRLNGVSSCKSNELSFFFCCRCYNSDLFDIRVSWRGWNEDFLLRTCVFFPPSFQVVSKDWQHICSQHVIFTLSLYMSSPVKEIPPCLWSNWSGGALGLCMFLGSAGLPSKGWKWKHDRTESRKSREIPAGW